MELKPHDLLKIRGMDALDASQPFPEWVQQSLNDAPFVVVRRAEASVISVPVGIRGEYRGQRFGTWLKANGISEVISPYILANPVNWKADYHDTLPATIATLKMIIPVLNASGFRWGPTGSTGFELATGIPVLKATSDLDLVISADSYISVSDAAALLQQLQDIATVRLDIQLETPLGGVALTEYVNAGIVMIKTLNGPVLAKSSTLWLSCYAPELSNKKL